jgi:hypothetical protein
MSFDKRIANVRAQNEAAKKAKIQQMQNDEADRARRIAFYIQKVQELIDQDPRTQMLYSIIDNPEILHAFDKVWQIWPGTGWFSLLRNPGIEKTVIKSKPEVTEYAIPHLHDLDYIVTTGDLETAVGKSLDHGVSIILEGGIYTYTQTDPGMTDLGGGGPYPNDYRYQSRNKITITASVDWTTGKTRLKYNHLSNFTSLDEVLNLIARYVLEKNIDGLGAGSGQTHKIWQISPSVKRIM